MCQITIDNKEIEYTIREVRLQKSNGKPASVFSEQFQDFLKLYFEIEVSDANYVPPNVFQPYFEILIDGNLHMSGTFLERYQSTQEKGICIIKIGTAGEAPFDMNEHTLTLKVYDTEAERKPDFLQTINFTIGI